MAKRIDLTGKRFSSLRVLHQASTIRVGGQSAKEQHKSRWICKCVCGVEFEVQTQSLMSGNTKSCGCLGRTTRSYRSKERKAWQTMKWRCYNRNHKKYKDYGGRGIFVCASWLKSFDQFLKDVGPAPSLRHTLDRKDVNRSYRKGNVKWSTPVEQGRNKRCHQ